MGKAKILIVEDDANINNMVCEALTKNGFECTQSFSGTEGLLNFKANQFDLAILDLMMPGMTGEELTAKIRETSKIPIIITSAKSELDSRVNLLSTGADDYLVKPFDVKELIARVEVQLRHLTEGASVGASGGDDKLTFKDMELNKSTFEVFVKGQEIQLTRQEYKILELFMLHPTKVFSKQDIFEYAWDEYYIGEDKTINVHISNIRKKLKEFTDTEFIETVWGIGYKLAK